MTKPQLSALDAAWQRRASLHTSATTNAYRLINRSGDGFPDLAVDRYDDVLVAHVYSQGVKVAPPQAVLQALADRVGAEAVYLKYRPVQGNVLDDRTKRSLTPIEPLIGRAVERVDVIENGSRYIIRPDEGLNPGLFLDMREVREFVRAQAAGKTVLNCFAYTCAFGVAGLQGGAARVLNLDISRHYLDWGRANAELNGYASVPTDFVKGDVFDWLKRFGKRGQKFDVVILDPPSYSTTHETRFSVERDTTRLVALAAQVVQPGGYLIACTNYEQLPQRGFVSRVREGLAGVKAKIIETRHEPDLDFTVASSALPYLKVCVVKFA
ncbi:MAG TPA: class I SAM-dependent rRNA methyltransferase [Anaerolineae bacterium]|nr:class I SAM-dependent rRNA methyltransferase [Anaerolineae bacterium]